VAAARLLEWEFRRLATKSPAVVAGDELGRRYGRSPHLITTGFSLVADGDLVDADVADRPAPDDPVILSVGRLDPEKNPVLLAHILAELVDRWPRARLRVVGAGPLAGELSEQARALSVRDHLDLVGQVPFGTQLRDEYRHASVLLHVSWTEGLPQVLFEAMAAGLPIVATRVGGVSRALGDGAFGALVRPGDAHAAAEAVDSVLRNPARRASMVRAALANAAHHTMTAQAAEIAALIAEVVRSSQYRRRA
jgi:glycosyltransferase involved in cell wall biosynthesis